MIQNTFFDYVTIRISIASLRLIAPASIVYLVCCAFFRPHWWNTELGIISAAEASFYLFVYLPRRWILQSPPTDPQPTLTRKQRELIFSKCLEAGQLDENHQPYFNGWFLDLPPNTYPKREDAVDWLLWSLFSTSREKVDMDDPELIEELNGYVHGIEKMVGKTLESGSSQEGFHRLSSMRITLDPVRMLHRPLVWYLIVALVDTYTSLILLKLGFKHYTPHSLKWRLTFPPRSLLVLFSHRAPEGVTVPYWYRPHKSQTKMPMVFLHGIGIGLYPYIPFIRSLISGPNKGSEGADDDIGILLPELMPISMHMCPRSVPPKQVMLASLELILDSLTSLEEEKRNRQKLRTTIVKDGDGGAGMLQPLLSQAINREYNASDTAPPSDGWNRIVLAAHSYGTFVAGWIVHLCVDADLVGSTLPMPSDSSSNIPLSQRITHLVLVDPIPILLSHPAVAHNFLYRDPATVSPHKLGSVGGLHLQLDSKQLANTDHNGLSLPVPPMTTPLTSPISNSYFSYSSAAAAQLYYFASRDADVARTLHRAFFWAEGGIWREEVEAFISGSGCNNSRRNMAIFLGGMDQIVPAEAVRKYLTCEKRWKERWIGPNFRKGHEPSGSCAGDDCMTGKHIDVGHSEATGKLEVLFNPRLDHAVLFDEEKWTVPLIEVIRKYVRDV
ncbi:hypothetical protein CPB84DRAFT_1853216 [Gymnopilus junonius]|uniref:AB hydrolase-1 domain-containing protein n=1 Tax=Gymnopilus junonius TaxID=109634 RepID=A0A9P5TFT6_GYMJU|nr:hypothetical protein CPB84DRAFT_1853216 [Gymnopilus junonius]